MSRLVLSQITIKKERSISSTTWYYLLQPSNASAPDSTNYGNPPPTYTDTGYSGWSTTEPTYTVGDDRVLYIMVQTLYSDNTFSYATPTISSSYEAAKDAYNEALQAEADIEDLQELGLHHGYIWYNSTARPASGGIPVYPVGSYIASGINNTINQTNSNTYGLNTWISTGGINLRYNAINLAKLTTSTLEFYYPSTSSQGTAAISLGTHDGINSLIFYGFGSINKQMELTATALNFYGSSQSNADVTLNSNGLNITKGSITLGGGSFVVTNNGAITATSGTIGGWYLGSNYLSTSTTGGTPGSGVITLSQGIAGPTSDSGVLPANQTWAFTASNNFGVTTNGTLYASGGSFNGRIEATEGYFSSTVTIGNGGTTLSTIEANAKQSQIYLIGVNNGTTGYHFLGTLTLSGQTAEAEIEIHTGDGQNNRAYQNLTVRVNIKRGYQATTTTTAGITVRYEGDPTIVTMGESNCSIIARCTTVGVLNIYMYTPNWGYADGWYQVKGRNWSWVHSGTLITTAPSEGTAQSITYMNPYTTATNYITDIDNQKGITVKPANSSDNDYLQINSTDIRFIRHNSAKTIITNSEITLYGGNTNTSYAKVNSNGLQIYKQIYNENKQVANFGEDARIGINDNNYSNIHITSNSMTISNKGVQTYKIENATNREIKTKIDLNYSFHLGDTSLSLDIELGRAVSSWINTGGVRGIVLTYDLWGDDYGDISQSYNGPTVTDTAGKYAFTSELNGSVMTITLGPGATLDGSETIYFTSVEFNFIAADPVVHNTIGAYANNTLSSPFKIGVGTASIPSNAMLVDFNGNTKIKGDLFIKCNDDSTGGMPLGTVRKYTQSSRPSGLRYLHIDAFQVGYTVTLVINFQMATSTASVGNYFTQILQEIPAPAHQHMRISGFGYTSGAIVGYWLAWTDGFWQLSARNLSGTTTGSSFGLTASLTYVTDGTLCLDNY